MADVDISDSRIIPIRVRRYTLHAIRLKSAAYGHRTSCENGLVIPRTNVKTNPATNVVLKNKCKYIPMGEI